MTLLMYNFKQIYNIVTDIIRQVQACRGVVKVYQKYMEEILYSLLSFNIFKQILYIVTEIRCQVHTCRCIESYDVMVYQNYYIWREFFVFTTYYQLMSLHK